MFPGNLQEIMNRVLATQRLAEAERVEANTKATAARIEAEAKADVVTSAAHAQAEAHRIAAAAAAEADRMQAAAERDSLVDRLELAQSYAAHPSLLRLRELEALAELGKNANARLYIGTDRAFATPTDKEERP